MPFDQKRINGPDTSFSYKQFIEQEENIKPTELKKKRADGRNWDESRKLAIQLKAITKAKGSCYLENGNTKVLCAVFELREIPRINKYADKGQLYCDFRYAPFSRENRKSVGENEEKLIASNIKTALESTVCLHEFPNYQIDVFILVLEDDGSVLSSSVIAAGLAFVDASIPCYDILTSSSVAVVNGKLLIDPTSEEEETENLSNKVSENHGTITISSLSGMEQVAQILFSGFVDADLIKQAKKHIVELNKTQVNYLKKVISLKISLENNES